MRTIRVTGKGQISVKPDMTQINIRMMGTYPEYSETVEHSAKETEELRSEFEKIGFAKTDLKTTGFDVSTQYESYRDSNGDYRQKFVGYSYKHTLKLEFPSDNERLGKVLFALSHGEVKARFGITFFAGNPEKERNLLLGKAVRDARDKAETLSSAAGVTLKAIQSIDYSWEEIDFSVTPVGNVDYCECRAAIPCDMAMEPENIEVEDTVTVIWEIE